MWAWQGGSGLHNEHWQFWPRSALVLHSANIDMRFCPVSVSVWSRSVEWRELDKLTFITVRSGLGNGKAIRDFSGYLNRSPSCTITRPILFTANSLGRNKILYRSLCNSIIKVCLVQPRRNLVRAKSKLVKWQHLQCYIPQVQEGAACMLEML